MNRVALLAAISVLMIVQPGDSEEPKPSDASVKHMGTKDGITLMCELKKEVASGGPYMITLAIKNETKLRIGLDEIGYLAGYEVTVLDSKRKAVPFTSFGRKRIAGMPGRGKEIWLKPGESSALRVLNLARLFDLSETGKYHAVIRRNVRRDRGDGQPRVVVVELSKLPLTLRDPTREDHAKWR